MPPKFMFPQNQRLWVPLAPYFESTGARRPRAPGVRQAEAGRDAAEQAATDLDGVAARLAADYPKENEGWERRLRPLQGVDDPRARSSW